MFVNMLLLSLLTIIYGTKGDEGGGSGTVEKNVMNFLSESQQRGDDLNFIKTPRSIRTPFRNTEIMTARGFGKRNKEEQAFNDNYSEKRANSDALLSSDDYREESIRIGEKPLLFPFVNQLIRNQENSFERDNSVIPSVRNHRLQIRDGTLKFRLNDGNLRIGRGFGKRSYGDDPYAADFKAMQFFRKLLSQNQQLSPLALNNGRQET